MKKNILLASMLLFGLLLAPIAEASHSNAPYNWGFNRGKNGQPAEAGQMLDDLIAKYNAIYKGDQTKKNLYLTFDNGYENGYTAQVLNVLKRTDVRATFFVTGHYLKTAPELAKRMVREGHIIGNHSWYHPDMTQITNERIVKELEMVRAETERLTGQKTMNYLRPPRGIFSERTMAAANAAGYKHIFWSLAYKDWDVNQQKGAKYAYDSVMKQIHPGAIMLIHTVSKDNADALESIIKDLKKQGYTFRSLDDLMVGEQLKQPMLY